MDGEPQAFCAVAEPAAFIKGCSSPRLSCNAVTAQLMLVQDPGSLPSHSLVLTWFAFFPQPYRAAVCELQFSKAIKQPSAKETDCTPESCCCSSALLELPQSKPSTTLVEMLHRATGA